jgi:diaminohydroxyphosphoribosylaminopyrimidine deaminase/5-amino-6-(5-phosphoribosylamino)uracil reductase
MPTKKDTQYIRRTFELAKKGAGYVSPNPLVGAVLVKDSRIIGEGYHQKFGQAHAELNAIHAATEPVQGATLYCNLEPCCHSDKKTPPCAQRIIQMGIHKVIICSLDPNPKVNGQGVALLRDAGIKVEVGMLQEENEELNRFFFKYIRTQLPYVTVKIAQTLDGRITHIKGQQTWVTSAESIRVVHTWRSKYDAVLVGDNTVKTDNCALTVRKIKGRNPIRVILSGEFNLNMDYQIFRSPAQKTLILTGKPVDAKMIRKFALRNVMIHVLEGSRSGLIPIQKVLKFLAEKNIASVLIEGGQQVFSQFIFNNLMDELKVFISPQIWGRGLPAIVLGRNRAGPALKLTAIENSGEDLLLTYRCA